MRLDKYLSLAQIATRKKVKAYIYAGMVTVNGVILSEPSAEIDENKDVICFQKKQITSIDSICYLFHKPQGCITAKSDAIHKTVFDYFQDVDTAGLFPIGRLDQDTEGLLLITNDGALSHRLMDPEHHVDKTYYFWVFGGISKADEKALQEGIDIGADERTASAKLQIVKQGNYEVLQEDMRRDGCLAVKKNLHRQEVTAGYLTISEGKKHQVKRMMRAVGCRVVYLKRVSIGRLQLDEQLPPGAYRRLSPAEYEYFQPLTRNSEGRA